MIERRTLLTLALTSALVAGADGGALAEGNGGRVLPDPMFGRSDGTAAAPRFGARPVPPPAAPQFGSSKRRRDGVSFTPEFTIRAPSKRGAAPSPRADADAPDAATRGKAAAAPRTAAAEAAPTLPRPQGTAGTPAPAAANAAPAQQSKRAPRSRVPTHPRRIVVPTPAARPAAAAAMLAGHGGDARASEPVTAAATAATLPQAAAGAGPRRHPLRPAPRIAAAVPADVPAPPVAAPDVLADAYAHPVAAHDVPADAPPPPVAAAVPAGGPPRSVAAVPEGAAVVDAAISTEPATAADPLRAETPAAPAGARLDTAAAVAADATAPTALSVAAADAAGTPGRSSEPAVPAPQAPAAAGAAEPMHAPAVSAAPADGHGVAAVDAHAPAAPTGSASPAAVDGAAESSGHAGAADRAAAPGDGENDDHGGSGAVDESASGDGENAGAEGGDEAAEEVEEAFDPVWDSPDTQDRPYGPTPARLGRMLTALQDDIALGSSDALAAQRVLARRIAERFRAATPKEWREDANARALVLYGLSGGDPKVLRDVVKTTKLKRPYEALAAGALAYLEGRAKDARRHFAKVPDGAVPHSLEGSVFLARAALNVSEDPATALALLDEARIAAPGTLVEEAALRRAILIAAERDDVDTFERLVGRYLRAFRTSVYAGNFRQRLAAAITRMTFIRDPASFGRLEAMLGSMTPAGRQELYLLLARAAIENGNPVAAQLAARRVQESADPASLDGRRARLYQAAAEVVDAPLSLTARTTLSDMAAEPLPEADRALLSAAQRLARSVTDLPPPALAPPADDGAPPTGPDGVGPLARDAPIALEAAPAAAEDRWPAPAALEARVADVLSATNELLETAR